MPTQQERIPDTIKRSPAKVRRAYEETLDSAHEQYRSEERAHRAAWASVKHIAEKVGDHWELKRSYGASDPQSTQHGAQARSRPKATAGGVDVYGHTKQELYQRAKRAGIKGRSRMTKLELAQAIARRNA
jgi:cation transport regulator ChaB